MAFVRSEYYTTSNNKHFAEVDFLPSELINILYVFKQIYQLPCLFFKNIFLNWRTTWPLRCFCRKRSGTNSGILDIIRKCSYVPNVVFAQTPISPIHYPSQFTCLMMDGVDRYLMQSVQFVCVWLSCTIKIFAYKYMMSKGNIWNILNKDITKILNNILANFSTHHEILGHLAQYKHFKHKKDAIISLISS